MSLEIQLSQYAGCHHLLLLIPLKR